MTMDRKLILSIITASAFIAWVIIVSHTYGYNLTKEQEQESAILPLCYTNNTLGIEGLNKTCNNIYGGPVVPNITKCLTMDASDRPPECFANGDGIDAEFDNDTMSSQNNWTAQEYCHDHNGNGTIVCHNMTGMKMN